ncbi:MULTISPECIES: DUF3077 domain-containing protein [unclassified Pseudomonas]|uniref:DUF3077 domain-containing protein n=1 Tax=unclassified Pseudomonas TaxID=196821 RepID=UPI001CBB8019|nr:MULTISPECIES: DUF3077 domain-containing protein [unclassified Pseudomonas]
MTHPKNTTGPSRMQHRLLTEATDFATVDGENRQPFGVNAGIPVGEAMNMATGLLGALQHIATMCIDRDPDVNDVVAIRFLAMASQALITASVLSVELCEGQGGAQ